MLVVLFLAHLSLSGAVQSGIFGGRTAKKHSRPYMASLQVRGHHVCGGVLIREDYVLTAAHCLNFGPLEVVLGAHNICQEEPSQQRIQVKQPHQHPQFTDKKQFDYDIMLLQLSRKAKLNEYVRLMGLPKKDGKVPETGRGWVLGWGRKRPGSREEPLLQEAEVPLENQQTCEDTWGENFNSTHMICSSTSKGSGFCQGDSGGPLVCKGKAQGVIAYTASVCNSQDHPQVSMKISAFLPWMKTVMDKQDSKR